MPKYKIYRIMDFVDKVGEETVMNLFSGFSCEYKKGFLNSEVELFLKRKSVDFAKKKMSITYLVLDDLDQVTGFFTLTHKPVVVKNQNLSNTSKRKLLRHAKYDPAIDAYSVSAFLIAQIGKNYDLSQTERISGQKLMEMTLSVIEDIQQQIGGGVVFLEAEEHQELLDFYKKQRFTPFDVRCSEEDKIQYIQMIRFL